MTLARLLRPQGRRGELLAELMTSSPELLSSPSGIFLVPPGATSPQPDAQRILVESTWMPTGRNAGRIVVKLAGCDSISAAELLAKSQLMLPAEERPPLEDDTYYVSDLIGCDLYDGEMLAGKIVDVEFATSPDGKLRLDEAAPLLVVQRTDDTEDTEPAMVPFVRAFLQSVDTTARRIVMNLPEGLLD